MLDFLIGLVGGAHALSSEAACPGSADISVGLDDFVRSTPLLSLSLNLVPAVADL